MLMYQMNEISNRDLSLLHYYRILRKPADFLSAIYNAGEPEVTEIFKGSETEFETDSGSPIYGFSLDLANRDGYIPYLEFDTKNENDRKHLETLLYLDDMTIYGNSAEFEEPVQVKVYWVSSLDSIRQAIDEYLAALEELDITKLRQKFSDKKNQPKGIAAISGRDQNLVQFTESESGLTMKDSDYMITSALDAQMLVNPSQELLMSLPRKLKHSINISVTDGDTRYLESFSGYSINIKGNGDWVMRDVESGINLITGSGKVYLWNCRLVHFRTTVAQGVSIRSGFQCRYLHAHRSLVVLNQCEVDDICIVGGTTLIAVPTATALTFTGLKIKHVTLIGHGCSYYSWDKVIPINPTHILGTAWWCNLTGDGTALYIAGRRIDEISGEHDEELKPSRILEFDVDNIHIRQGGD